MKLAKVVAWEFRRTTHNKQFILMTVLLPAIIGLAGGGVILFGGGADAAARTPAGPPPPFLVPMIFAMILFIGAFLNGTMTLYGVVKEKASRVVEIVLSSISSRELMAGKILGQGLAGLIQVVLWGGVAAVVLSALVPGLSWRLTPVQWVSYPLYFALGYLLISALFATLAAGMKDVQSSGAQFLVGMLPYLPMMFAAGIIQQPNTTWIRIASFFPPFTPGMMMIRVSIAPVPWWEVAGTILVLGLFDLIFVRVAARAFETAVLMYGKNATLRELWRWGVRRRRRR
jgi:ABC-2 type transport system permease protein